MRIVLDTNVLLSGLINPHGSPAKLIDAWRSQRFTLITSAEQLLELGEVARRPSLRKLIAAARVGTFINDLRELAQVLVRLPTVDRSTDPADNFSLAMAEAGQADYLVSGDKRHVLMLKQYAKSRIATTHQMLAVLGLK